MQVAREKKLALLALARRALNRFVFDSVSEPAAVSDPVDRIYGAFVSLHRGDDLRGCIGRLDAHEPVGRLVQELVIESASRDPRFQRVTSAEATNLSIEISLLHEPRIVQGPADIHVGRDGLIIESNGHRGVLLPQVAPRHGWSAEAFLSETCLKAGLASDAWRKATVRAFGAEVFSQDALPLVLFACVHNSCRSQMAEGWARHVGRDWMRVASAGSEPSGTVDPGAIETMKSVGIDISHHTSKKLAEFDAVDILVTMGCGEQCPHIRARRRIDWQIEDPKGKGPEAVAAARNDIEGRIRSLLKELTVTLSKG